jgi:lactobin A/cerein 7B family class IIb bacteriocin
MKNLENFGVQELNTKEMEETNGGVAILGVLAVVAVGAGVLVVGAAVGYGLYRLVKWAVS